MKKYQTGKRNPNPPWPNEQSVVMVPPGVSAEAVGMSGQRVYNGMTESDNSNIMNEDRTYNGENYQIMDDAQRPTDNILQNRPMNGMMMQAPVSAKRWESVMPEQFRCGNTYITGYLCEHTGKYVRMEFLFGEQTHVDKTGVLREVGNNYVVMQEMGTDNMIVCPLDKIKFINIYNVNNNEKNMR